MKIPQHASHYSLTRTWLQPAGQARDVWVRKVKVHNAAHVKAPVIGVPDNRAFHDALADLQTWDPTTGWLYLQGPVGTGKTTLAAALGNRLHHMPEAPWVPVMVEAKQRDAPQFVKAWLANLPVHPTVARATTRGFRLRRGKVMTVHYCTEVDLHDAFKQSERNDHEALRPIMSASVLVLDDLGAAQRVKGSERAQEYLREHIDRVVCHRYDRGLSLVVTSNLPIRDMSQLYGDRVQSRLEELCWGHVHVIEGAAWRER